MSYRGPPTAIISMAQHARPKVIGHNDACRPQLIAWSSDVITNPSSNRCSSSGIDSLPGLRERNGRALPRHAPHPFQIASAPEVGKPDEKNAEENEKFKEGELGEFLGGSRSRHRRNERVPRPEVVEPTRRVRVEVMQDFTPTGLGHRRVAQLVGRAEHDRPRKEERDLDFKDDEQQGDNIKPQIELDPRSTDRLL